MTAGGAAVLGTGGISAAKHDRDLVDTTHVPIHTEQHDRDTLSENKHLPTPMEERQPEPTHLGRETAIIGGVGVLGAGGVYAATHDRDPLADTTRDAYGVEDPNKHNKLHKPTPDEKKLEKDHEKEAKEAQKQHEKEEKERQKAFEKAEKERVKEAEKAEKERIKEAEKAEKKHEKVC
jgi:flagellar biosynthesis GTPase FlhF